VPVWIAMSKTLALSSSKSSSEPARIRWPVDEIGELGQALDDTHDGGLSPAKQYPRGLLKKGLDCRERAVQAPLGTICVRSTPYRRHCVNYFTSHTAIGSVVRHRGAA
jgi:hypothetical protein